MAASHTPAPSTHKPLHHQVFEALEHVVDRFGMYMAIGAMLVIAASLLTVR